MSSSTELAELPGAAPLTPEQLAAALVKHYGLTSGKFSLSIEFKIASGKTPLSTDVVIPGLFVGIGSIGLTEAKADSYIIVDAAVINPPKRAKKS